MALTEIFTSGVVTLAPGQTKTLVQGHPLPGGYVTWGECWVLWVCPLAGTGIADITLLGTSIRDAPPQNDPAAFPITRLFYTVRNNDTDVTHPPVSFIRTSVRIRP